MQLIMWTTTKEATCDTCGGELIQRTDDAPETVANRLRVYHEQTSPLIDFYQAKGVLKSVDGTRSIDDVFADICAILDKGIWQMIKLKSEREIHLMRQAGAVAAQRWSWWESPFGQG